MLTAAVNFFRFFFHRVIKKVEFYIKTHSYFFAIQLIGVLFSIVAAIILSIFEIVSFDALNSIVNSATAEWQIFFDIVEAKSLFTWFQNAIMKKIVINEIIITYVAKKRITALATAVTAVQNEILDVDELMKKFKKIYKKRNYKNVEKHNWAE